MTDHGIFSYKYKTYKATSVKAQQNVYIGYALSAGAKSSPNNFLLFLFCKSNVYYCKKYKYKPKTTDNFTLLSFLLSWSLTVNSLPPKNVYVEVPITVLQNVTVFGDRSLKR